MIREVRSLVAGLALAAGASGCAIGPVAPEPLPAGATIDARILGRYDTSGDVLWMLVPGRRPRIGVLSAFAVTFVPGTSPERAAAIAAALGARVVGRTVLPADPTGTVPARATDDYVLAFEPHPGSLADLPALAARVQSPIAASAVFSSERALRIYHAWLRAREVGPAWGVAGLYLDVLDCWMDCRAEPGDPYAAPAAPAAFAPAAPTPPPALVSTPPAAKWVVLASLFDPMGRSRSSWRSTWM